MTRSARAIPPRRILFSLLHAGYLRHYLVPLRLLAERGHWIHIAISQPDHAPADRALLERLLATGPNVTVSYGLERSSLDGWRQLAWVVRGLTDLARYSDPRYEHAFALRNRMHANVVDRLRESREPLSRAFTTRWAERIGAAKGTAAARRNARLLALLETAIPPSRRHLALLRDWKPDVVLASPVVEVASSQVEFVKAARSLGIPSAVAVASWDNLTNKGLIRVLPNRVLVWNEIQRKEASELHGVPNERVIVTGAQRYDEWFERKPSTSWAEFTAKAGIRAELPFVLYLGSSPFVAPDEASFVGRWLGALRSSGRPALEAASVVIRPHPENAAQWRAFEPPAGVVVWPRAGAQPDEGEARADFFDTLSHASAVVGVNTSALIESGLVGKSVYTVLDPDFAGTQEGTLHFHYLLTENGGFLHVARDLDEHLAQLDAGLRGDADDVARNLRFAEAFVRPHGLDRPSAPLVVDAIEQIAALGRLEPERLSISARALRLALTPVALGSGAVAALPRVGLLLQRGRREPTHEAR